LFAFVVLSLVSSVPCQGIGREERLRSDLFCVKWDVKPGLWKDKGRYSYCTLFTRAAVC